MELLPLSRLDSSSSELGPPADSFCSSLGWLTALAAAAAASGAFFADKALSTGPTAASRVFSTFDAGLLRH